MKDLDCLCAGCWNELTEGAVCAECGFDNDTQNETINLGIKTVLDGRYVIGKVEKVESDARATTDSLTGLLLSGSFSQRE